MANGQHTAAINEPIEQQEQSYSETPSDALLSCLLFLSKHFERPCSARVFVSGLPLENNRLTADLFPRAAERAQMEAQIHQMPLSEINTLALPVVLILENNQACVLMKLDTQAHVILPETGNGINQIAINDLAQQYTGQCIFVKPQCEFSARSEEIMNHKGTSWFWRVLVKSWPIYSEVLVASALINCFALAIPLFVMNVYDRVVPNHAIETMWVLASGVAVIFIFDFRSRYWNLVFI